MPVDLSLIKGFIYPNEGWFQWSFMLVIYPYITGLVAGAFVVSAFYEVFHDENFKPVSKLALICSLAFLIVCVMPLQFHLTHHLRGFEIFMTPHLTSAMAGFGFVYLWYLLILLLEIWFNFREKIVEGAESKKPSFRRFILRILLLGSHDVSEKAMKTVHKVAHILAIIGIPSACFLHGYVGFIFGSIKANHWWASPLMPFIFLLSAVVSGVAMMYVLYWICCVIIKREPMNHKTLNSFIQMLFGFLIVDLAFEGLELLQIFYAHIEATEPIKELIKNELMGTYVWGQAIIGSGVPLIILIFLEWIIPWSKKHLRQGLMLIASLFVLGSVLLMRWNVVIGGQELSRSLLGTFHFTEVFGTHEGVGVGICLLILPFILMTIFSLFLDPWEYEKKEVN
ncbi:MAG: polysulfide reductase NrfD [Deltaproteobacteria bacterium]|nr:polysulfide reductase NrfD [Deltaproteobacteria bacterium]